MIYYSYKKEGFEQVMVMFGKQKARLHGYESYGRIIKIEDGFYLYRGLPSKYVTVEYHVNQQHYEGNISFGIMWIKLINNTCSQI